MRREDATAASLAALFGGGDMYKLPHARPAAWEAAAGRKSLRRGLNFFLEGFLISAERKVDGIILRRSGLEVREESVFPEEEYDLRMTGGSGLRRGGSLRLDSASWVVAAGKGEGRPGMVGGLERSVYPTAGTVPSPIQPGVVDGGDFPEESFRLWCRASRRSTRSRHWSSNWRIDSWRAFSVSFLGEYLEGTR